MIKNRGIFYFVLNLLIFILQNASAKENHDDFKTRKNLTRREIGYFWHVSDILFDPNYSPLAAPEDDCRMKDSGSNSTKNCGFFGELGKCSAFGLVETIARAMKSTRWKIVAPEFCIFTGNLRCPNAENDAEIIYQTMSAFVTDVKNAGFVNVYPSYGWYDYHPYGHHPLKSTTLYEKFRNLLHGSKKSSSQGLETGYFSRIEKPENRIRVIVMNTNFYLKNHIASRLSDPAGQWKWLIDELGGCKMTLQKAFLVMSVPPGFYHDRFERDENQGDDLVWSERHTQIYNRIINEYHEVIAAQFAGHKHQDTFRLVYNREGKVVSAILIAPPINSIFGNYPAMRIYMYDKKSGELLDFVQYYFNLTKANFEVDTTDPEKYWEVGYSFRDFYHLPDVTSSSLKKLVLNFRKNDILFQRYQNKIQGFPNRNNICQSRCKLFSICLITSIDLGNFIQCISGKFMEKKNLEQRFQFPGKSLRDRLIKRSMTNPVSASPKALVASSIYITVVIFYTLVS